MGLSSLFGKKPVKQPAPAQGIAFASTADLERLLDGSDESFRAYYFALYHLYPDEICDFNSYRQQLCLAYPSNAVSVGRHHVLWGEPAFQVAKSYYEALAAQATPEEFREYAKRRLSAIAEKHRASQSLPRPIDLSEGQLNADTDLEFFARLAISNRQVFQI
ncbi:MAG: hypothetical protein RL500_1386 [Pseudomonadota bacterium]